MKIIVKREEKENDFALQAHGCLYKWTCNWYAISIDLCAMNCGTCMKQINAFKWIAFEAIQCNTHAPVHHSFTNTSGFFPMNTTILW